MLYFVLGFQIFVIVAGVGIHLIGNPDDRTGAGVFKDFVPWFIAAVVGLGGVWAFIGHAFFADETAEMIGWPAGNPFQFEVAVTNLSYGVLGLLCLHYHGKFWWATVIGYTVFMWGAAYGHIYEIAVNNNHEPGNAGFVLYADIITPIILFALLITYGRMAGKEPAVAVT